MRVVDRIAECRGLNRRPLPVESIRYGIIHRISLVGIQDCDLDAADIARIFLNPELGTDGKIPYHFLVRKNGIVEQMLRLTIRAAHANRWNNCSIGIAAAGDFTKEMPSPQQWNSLLALCRELYPINNLNFFGHTQLEEGAKDKGKICPGPFLPVDKLINQIFDPGWVTQSMGIVI